MARRKGQFAISTVVGLLAVFGIVVGGTFFAGELMTLLKLITNNLFYAGILAVSIIIAFTFNSYVKANTDLSPGIAAGGAILVMGLAIGAPFLTGAIADMQRTYTATFEAEASGGQISQVAFNGIELQELEQGGPRFFSVARQASILSTDYDVEVTLTCDGEEIGVTTISGNAPGTSTGQISGIPPQTSCVANAEMTKPSDHGGMLQDQVRFNTP